MNTLALLALVLVSASALTFNKRLNLQPHHGVSDEFIKEINSEAKTWVAGRNFHPETPAILLRTLAGGVLPNHMDYMPPAKPILDDQENQDELPTTFDSREKWPLCKSISMIWDQSSCGSCWAFGAANAMSDRLCIHSGTGNGCQPYEIDNCKHDENGEPVGICPFMPFTPKCHRGYCDNKDYNIKYAQDLTFGQAPYTILKNEKAIMRELMTNGPVEGAMTVYEDFMNYNKGVYTHVKGDEAGGHAIRILGWGEENSTPYWLVANSWNSTWGDNGLFKILRGQDHCGIESSIIAALPQFK